MLLEHIRKFG